VPGNSTLRIVLGGVRALGSQWQTIVDAIPALAWSAGSDGIVTSRNQHWLEYAGLSPEPDPKAPWMAIAHPDDREGLTAWWQSPPIGAGSLESQARLRRFDGEYRSFQFRRSPLAGETEDAAQWLGVGLDIDAFLRPEQASSKSDPGFQPILENLPGFVAVMGAGGEVEFASQQVLNYFGTNMEQLSQWMATNSVHPDDLSRVIARWMYSVESGEPYEIEHRLRRADGVYRWFHVSGRAERNAQGQIVRWHQALIDIEDRIQAEESARANERNFREIIDSIPGFVHTMTQAGEVEFVSQPVLDFFGKTREEMDDWSPLVHSEDRAGTLSRVGQAIVSGKPYAVETRVLRADGVYRWFSSLGKPVRNAEGRIVRWCNLLVDIDDRKRAEQVLQRSESYLSEAQKLSHTGSFGLNVVTGEIVWSDETYRITEFDRNIKPTLELILELVHPEDRVRVRSTLDSLIQSSSNWDFEHRFLMPDGSVKHVHVVADATINQFDQLEYIGAVIDLTAAKQAEEELRRSEEKYRDLIELSPDSIYVVDEAGILVSTNPAGLAMLRCTPEEAIGLNVADTHLPEDQVAYHARRRQLKAGGSFHFERTFVRMDGTTVPVEVLVSPIRNGCSLAVLRDISERKNAQEALERSQFYLAKAEELSHSGSWAYEIATRKTLYWSPEYFRLEHRGPTDPLPTFEEIREGFTPEDWAALMEEEMRSIREKRDFTIETRRTLRDGFLQHIRVIGHPLVDATGEAVAMMGTTMDITEQAQAKAALKQAFEEIRRSEDQLRLIVDTVPALAWSTNPEGNIEFVNRRWRDYTGLSVEQAQGSGWTSAIYGDDLENLLEVWNAALASRAPIECEARMRRMDGEYRWFLFRTVPWCDEAGNVVKWYGTNTDIEDRKRAEGALRASEHTLRTMLNSISGLVTTHASTGELELANQPFLDYTGETIEELRDFAHAMHSDDVGNAMARWAGALRTGEPLSVEARLRRKDGIYRWFNASVRPLRDPENRIIRWYSLLTDIEDRKRAEQALQRSESYLSEAQKLSHTGSIGHNVVTGGIFWSDETYRILQFDLNTKPTLDQILERVHPEDRLGVQETLDRLIQTSSNWDFEHRLLMPDGSVKHVHVVADATSNELNQVEYIGAVIDLTAAKQAQEELRRSEEKYRELMQLSPDAIYILDEKGNLVLSNPAGLELLRCTPEEASSFNIAETCLPEERALAGKRIRELNRGSSYKIERTVLRRDGSTFLAEISTFPVRNGLTQSLVRDITERSRAQQILQRSEFYLSQGEKLSHAGSWAYDVSNKKIIFWSPENYRLKQHDPSQPLPTLEEMRASFSPEDWAVAMEHWQRSIRAATDFDFEARQLLPDGSIQNIRVIGHPLVNESGDVVEIIGITRDITEQVQAKVALEKAFVELQRSEDRLRLIVDTIPAQVWSTGSDGSLEFANQRWREFTGLSTDDVMGGRWRSAIHPDDLEAVSEVWSSSTASDAPSSECEARLRSFDGEYRWFLFRSVPLYDDGGKVAKRYGTSTDIEDRKRAEGALRASEHTLRMMLNSIAGLVTTHAPTGELELANQPFLDYTGETLEELKDYAHVVHPDDFSGAMAHWANSLATGEPLSVEARLRRKDGVYRWFNVSSRPLRDPEGRITRWYSLLTDIEQQKSVEAALRTSERELTLIVETIPALVWCASPSGELTCVNQRISEYIGVPLENLTENGWAQFIHPHDLESVARNWSHSVATGEFFEAQCRLRRADGVYHWVHSLSQLGFDSQGGKTRWYGLFLDIDDRMSIEESLRIVQDRLSRAAQTARIAELSASIAHEINQPLAAIVLNGHACLRWLAAQPPHLPNAYEAAERIVSNGKDAGEVVQRIRALFKKSEAERTTLNVNHVIYEVVRLLSGEIDRERVVVETRFADDLPDIVGDRIQLQQLVLNLLLNGIEAMNPVVNRPKRLLVCSKRQGSDNILVEISDSGEGLKDAERIFDSFYTTKPNGMGMGLAICRSITESHNGRLWAESRDDSGATFCFTLPVCSRVDP